METIKLRCKNCNAPLNIDSDNDIIICPYCDEKIYINENDKIKEEKLKSNAQKAIEFKNIESREKIEIERMKSWERDTKRGIALFLGLLCFIIIVMCVIGISEAISKKNKIAIPISSKEAKSENYKIIEQYYIEAGFTNIKTVPDKDTWDFYNNGEVTKVTVNGTTWFKTGSYYKPDVPVIISYYKSMESTDINDISEEKETNDNKTESIKSDTKGKKQTAKSGVIKLKYNDKDWSVNIVNDNRVDLSLTYEKKESLEGSNRQIVFVVASLEENGVSDYDLETISNEIMPTILGDDDIKITKSYSDKLNDRECYVSEAEFNKDRSTYKGKIIVLKKDDKVCVTYYFAEKSFMKTIEPDIKKILSTIEFT